MLPLRQIRAESGRGRFWDHHTGLGSALNDKRKISRNKEKYFFRDMKYKDPVLGRKLERI